MKPNGSSTVHRCLHAPPSQHDSRTLSISSGRTSSTLEVADETACHSPPVFEAHQIWPGAAWRKFEPVGGETKQKSKMGSSRFSRHKRNVRQTINDIWRSKNPEHVRGELDVNGVNWAQARFSGLGSSGTLKHYNQFGTDTIIWPRFISTVGRRAQWIFLEWKQRSSYLLKTNPILKWKSRHLRNPNPPNL